MRKINVLSLFDGISCGQVALNNNKNILVEKYFASEIETSAINVTQYNFPNTIQLGDVTNITEEYIKNLGKIDLLLGGFPCQDLSQAGKRAGIFGERSSLFFYYVDALKTLKKINPKIKFILENVKGMTKEDKKIIDDYMGVEGFLIDSAMFSPQRRKRYYWTNLINKTHLNNSIYSNLVIKDILEKENKDYQVPQKYYNIYKLLKSGEFWKHLPDDNLEKIKILESRKKHKNPGGQTGFWKVYDINQKSPTLTASGLKQKMTRFVILDNNGCYRYPSPLEFERLQGLPDNYTAILKDSHRYKVIGNGWNIPTIEFLIKNI